VTTFPYADLLYAGLFGLAVTLTLLGAFIAALSQRIIRGVSGLMLCCLGLAGLFYFLHSPFLALMEILIYVGAVCITIVFGVMLSEPDEPVVTPEDRARARGWKIGTLLASLLLLAVISTLSLTAPWQEPATRVNEGSVADLGVALLTTHLLAFELISLVLVVAILGALVIARAGRTKE
jgi:NADH:ubiquinone oxidoreductase subunit 6 (subunit J)